MARRVGGWGRQADGSGWRNGQFAVGRVAFGEALVRVAVLRNAAPRLGRGLTVFASVTPQSESLFLHFLGCLYEALLRRHSGCHGFTTIRSVSKFALQSMSFYTTASRRFCRLVGHYKIYECRHQSASDLSNQSILGCCLLAVQIKTRIA